MNLDEDIIKFIMLQLLTGIQHLHSQRILHRDLKPQNILVSESFIVKIADFGLSRVYHFPTRPYTKEISTLYYRAPELILSCDEYITGVDVWGIGCIFAELFIKKPLFKGENEWDQLSKIFR